MPNTLAHIGIQGLATRTLLPDADVKWIYLGCFIPDVPWIMQRVVKLGFPNTDFCDLRLYSMIQASLFFSLMLSLIFALISRNPGRIFAILGLNSLFHLLLDACQTKWGNGVHLFAPVDWTLVNFNLFWPESVPTYLLTIWGLIYLLKNWRGDDRRHCVVNPHLALRRIWPLTAVVIVYFALPFLFFDAPKQGNNHYVRTLCAVHDRVGRRIELDRVSYLPNHPGPRVRTFSKENIVVENMKFNRSVEVSLKGIFTANNRIQVTNYHLHFGWFRNGATMLGLSLILSLWVYHCMIPDKHNYFEPLP